MMINTFKKATLLLCLTASVAHIHAQTLTIENCYELAKKNYPLSKQRELIIKSKEYLLNNSVRGYLPQLTLNGQATYQSEVTKIPIKLPGMDIPVLNKDQYKVFGEATQLIYDGGMIKEQKEAVRANAILDEQKLEIELYQLKERINQLFFGILLIDEQLTQANSYKKDVQLGINKTEASVANGTAFRSNVDVLKVELLKLNQRSIELKSNRKAYTGMLGLFINQDINEETSFSKPMESILQQGIRRPELLFYDYQVKSLSIQDNLLTAKNKPKLSLFMQGGLGRPGLNLLNNDFKLFAIGGIRLNWALTNFYTLKSDRAQIEVNRKNIAVQKEVFLFNTNYALKQQSQETIKLQELLNTDNEIIALRTAIKNTSAVQLENGVINTNDFLREANAEDESRQNKILHEVQLLLAQYTQQTTTGN